MEKSVAVEKSEKTLGLYIYLRDRCESLGLYCSLR